METTVNMFIISLEYNDRSEEIIKVISLARDLHFDKSVVFYFD